MFHGDLKEYTTHTNIQLLIYIQIYFSASCRISLPSIPALIWSRQSSARRVPLRRSRRKLRESDCLAGDTCPHPQVRFEDRPFIY